MNTQSPAHSIKVPIFSSEIITSERGLFDEASYDSMLKFVKDKVDYFNLHKPPVKSNRRNKIKETQISEVEYFDYELEGVPTLLLKITAYNTNLIDGYFENEEKIILEKNHKLGSVNNFVLIYPMIKGDTTDTFQYQWKFFVYDDPTKDTFEIISIIKMVCKQILKIQIRNLKLENVLKEIRETHLIESLELSLMSNSDDTDDDSDFKEYVIKSEIKKTKKVKYENIPTDKFEELLNIREGFKRRVLKVIGINKEIKITQERKDDLQRISDTIEEILNSNLTFLESDIDNIFENEFIVKNLNIVITDFIKQ